MSPRIRKILFLAAVLGLVEGCGAVGTSTGNPSAPKAFPAGLAVASPFETVTAESAALAQTTPFVKGYADATAKIEAVLNGTTAADCRFDPALLSRVEDDAGCYGPSVAYENHPDTAGGPDGGVLPHGDVGLWTETDAATGHACAAAQLNRRMMAMRDRTLAALSALAGLICTATANGLLLPDDATLDLTTQMNAVGISSVTFNAATLSESTSSGGDTWSYHLDLSFDSFDAVVDLVHVPGGTEETYRGRLSYRIDQAGGFGGCPSSDQTYNGSLLYDRSAPDRLRMDARGANFCGQGTDGLADGLVDPSRSWASNFHLFVADFDPGSLDGDYSFSWQAGALDSNSRVLNATLESPSTDALSGQAFYGFGPPIDGTDGGIDGFICNWAGPGNDHTLKPLAQSQEMALSASTGKFTATASNITYAPVNACNYTAGSGFRYDRDGNGTIDAEVSVTNDLIDLLDADANGVFDAFQDAGFALPVAPSNF